MRQYISEGRAMYEDENHGLFSKRLAEWAIDNMKVKDTATGELKAVKGRTLEDVKTVLKAEGVELPEAFDYTAWYLFNMAVADNRSSLPDDSHRAMYVKETINDPDGCPEAVLECFVAKMCLKGIPIHWEKMI